MPGGRRAVLGEQRPAGRAAAGPLALGFRGLRPVGRVQRGAPDGPEPVHRSLRRAVGRGLFAGPGASIATMATLGWAADRMGRRAFLLAVICAYAFRIAGLTAAGSFFALVAALVVYSSAGGLYDVGINAAAVALEGYSGRRFMSYPHAAYSGGALAASRARAAPRPGLPAGRVAKRPVAMGPAWGRGPAVVGTETSTATGRSCSSPRSRPWACSQKGR